MRHTQSTMGFSHVWYLDLPGVFGQTQGTRCPLVVRSIHFHGQVEGCRIGENESRWE